MQEDNVYEIDLREIFQVLRGRIRLIIICALIGAIIAGFTSFVVLTPNYASTSKLYILTKTTSITSLADIQAGSSLASDYVELVKSRPVVEKVISDMKLKISYETMLTKMTVKNPENTRILAITITDDDPVAAKEITNDFAMVAKVRISKIMDTDEPTIVEKGVVDSKPVSPDKTKNTLIGLLLGLFLSMMYVIVRHMMDDTIKNSDDISRYLELETIGMIPLKEGTTAAGDRKKFRMQRHKKAKKTGGEHR